MDKYIGTTEAAKLLGISRVAVFKRIQSGKITALKVGGNYIIDADSLGVKPDQIEKPEDKSQVIDRTMDRIFREYSDTIKRLGKE